MTPPAEKILSLEALADRLERERAAGRRVVQCHGVFDLLHIGHIRHFEQARKLGDLLVVTLTPDRHVNKGPHRPVFGEALRAEAIATLACVDFVAINAWPTAVEAIERLKPHRYVKGQDYRAAADDRTGGIEREEAAVRAVGGELAFTDDITFSSSGLINRVLPVFPREVTEFLTGFGRRHPAAAVIEVLERARTCRVLVVGEAIVDEYRFCEAIGKSSKDPMLAVRHLETEEYAGGILAVGNHVANFCDRVGMVTLLGDAPSREAFVREQVHPGVDAAYLVREGAPTIVKRRFIDRYTGTKLLEVYEMDDRLLDPEADARVCAALAERLPEFDLVIVVDFGHGMLSDRAVALLCQEAKFLAVNAQSNAGNLGYHAVSRYPRADYLCVAENEMRLEARDRRGDLREMMEAVSRRLSCPRVMVTRGKYGCLAYDREEGFVEVPALAGAVVDRVGAGDTFLALSALAVVQGAPLELAGFIGNAAGARQVATMGHRRSVAPVPLFKQIESLLK